MEIRDINWKKVRLLILIPVLVIASAIYMISGCTSEKAKNKDISLQHMETTQDVSGAQSEEDKNSDQNMVSEEISEDIYVDVGGAVLTPKVVQIHKGARIYEAIEAAGGKSKTAVTKYMNLAAVCEDGQKIYIPTETEITEEEKKSAVVSSAGYTGPDMAGNSSETGSYSRKVNINTASSDELQALTGIGPSMAERIIKYRNGNGKFGSVEELMEVSGIGEKTFAKFSDQICV